MRDIYFNQMLDFLIVFQCDSLLIFTRGANNCGLLAIRLGYNYELYFKL